MKFITSISLSIFCLLLFSQPLLAQRNIKGNGVIKKETRNISGFTGVSAGGAYDVYLKKGNTHKVVVEADENLMEVIETEKKDDKLVIRNKKNTNIRNAKKLAVYVTLPELDYIHASGATDVKGESSFSSRKMSINASGASDVYLDVDADALVCNLSGSSDVKLSGNAEQIGVSLSGSSDFKGEDLIAETGKIHASGSSSAHVYLSQSIEAKASGSSDIYCNGNPGKKQIHSSGASDINFR